MLDIKFVRDNPELVLENLKKRNNPMNLDRFMELEKPEKRCFQTNQRNEKEKGKCR